MVKKALKQFNGIIIFSGCEVTDKIYDGIKDQAKNTLAHMFIHETEFKQYLEAIIKTAHKCGQENKPIVQKGVSFEQNLNSMDTALQSQYSKVVQSFGSAIGLMDAARNYDARYITVKLKESFMALGVRIATTLAIGFSIMLVYWVAHCLEIPMPLLRLPVS